METMSQLSADELVIDKVELGYSSVLPLISSVSESEYDQAIFGSLKSG